MDNPYASYFVAIDGDENTLAKAEEYMQSTGIVPDYLDEREESETGILYSMSDGSMPRWNDMPNVFAKMSEKFPDLTITIDESCEEPTFPNRCLVFENGALQKGRYGRTLEPEEYDRVTIDIITNALRAAGMTNAADYITGMKLV